MKGGKNDLPISNDGRVFKRSTYKRFACVLLMGSIFFLSAAAYGNRPADTFEQAELRFPERRDNVVRRTVLHFKEKYSWNFPDWPDHARFYTARGSISAASAILWVLSHPGDFMSDEKDVYFQLQETAGLGTQWSSNNFKTTHKYWSGKINDFFDSMFYAKESHCASDEHVGTNCDYDFELVELAHLIYTYQDGDSGLADPYFDPANPAYVPHSSGQAVPWTYADFLTNEMIYNIVCQREGRDLPRCGAPPGYRVPYAFGELGEPGVFQRLIAPATLQPETENHVLGIVTIDVLYTNWVMWQGSLPITSRRYYQPMNILMTNKADDFARNAEGIYERALRAVGRAVHSGMFETNARFYSRVALISLLGLANYADAKLTDIPGSLHPAAVRQGAINAVNYLAVKFAFQSLRGKRQCSRRRKLDWHKYLDFYKDNGTALMFSYLSGAYEWDDCIETRGSVPSDCPDCPERPDCPIMRYDGNTYSWLLEAMLSASGPRGYRIPAIIKQFMFKRGPFYARMKPRFTIEHYTPLVNSKPKYFVNSTTAFEAGRNESSPELYFGDDHVLLSAGGSARRYYMAVWDPLPIDFLGRKLAKYHLFSRPTMLIVRGDFGHENTFNPDHFAPWEWGRPGGDALMDARDCVMLSPGKVRSWWQSECSVWLYKNFVYGYKFHDIGAVDAIPAKPGFSKQYPFDVPEFWSNRAKDIRRFRIGSARFEIYDFADAVDLVPPSAAVPFTKPAGTGYYIVRARLRKDKAGYLSFPSHREFARGFVEIVPREMFVNARALQQNIKTLNPAAHFNKDRDKPWVYILATSREKLTLDQEMGAKCGGAEECDNGILKIERCNTATDCWDIPVDMETVFLPPDISDSDKMKRIPLITVWQLDNSFRHTGRLYVETLEEGVIVIRRPASAVGWQCLKIDSRDYTKPYEVYKESENYEDCFVN
jgi:hypothetical protein